MISSLCARLTALRPHLTPSFLAGFILTILLGGWWMFGGTSSSSTTQTTSVIQVSRRTIVQSIKGLGTVTFADEQRLTFTQRGTVSRIFAKEGDRVRKGQVIAELDKTTVLASLRQSQLSVEASRLQLQQLVDQKNLQIMNAENTVSDAERQFRQAQNDLATAREQLPNSVDAAKRSVEEKEADVARAESDLAKAKATELQSLGVTAQNVLTSSQRLLDSSFSILTRGSQSRFQSGTPSFEIDSLLYNSGVLRDQAYYAFLDGTNLANAMRSTYGTTLPSIQDPRVLLTALQDAEKLSNALYRLSENIYAMLQGATTNGTDFTEADLKTVRDTVSSNRSTAATLTTTALTAQSSLSAAANGSGEITSITIQQKEDALATAQHALESAEENLALLTQKTPGDLLKQQDTIANLQEEYLAKQAALESTTKDIDVQIRLKQNDLAQRGTSLMNAAKSVEDYQITAPYDAVIRRIDYRVGDNLLADTTDRQVVLQNPDVILVTVLLDQTDVVRVHRAQGAVVTFDAVPGKSFTGSIIDINPMSQQTSGVVSYPIQIAIAAPKDLTILSGMTATVEIEIDRRESVLAVPNLAIKRSGKTATVQMADGTLVDIVTGLSDGRYTEVVSGLSEGDAILSINTTASGAQSSSSTGDPGSFFRGMGGGGGGRPPDR